MKTMDLNAQEKHLLAVLSSPRFLKMEGLSNEVPFFIYPFPPEASLEIASAKKRIKNQLSTKHGITVHEVNLYDLSIEILKERGVWERVLAHRDHLGAAGLAEKRAQQQLDFTWALVRDELDQRLRHSPGVRRIRDDVRAAVLAGELAAPVAADRILAAYDGTGDRE